MHVEGDVLTFQSSDLKENTPKSNRHAAIHHMDQQEHPAKSRFMLAPQYWGLKSTFCLSALKVIWSRCW